MIFVSRTKLESGDNSPKIESNLTVEIIKKFNFSVFVYNISALSFRRSDGTLWDLRGHRNAPREGVIIECPLK